MMDIRFRAVRMWLARPLEKKNVPGATRTLDLQLRRLTLYPSELQAHKSSKSG